MTSMSDFSQRFSVVSEIDKKLSLYNSGNTPGVATMVIVEGKVVFQKGYGQSNLHKKTPITTSSNFRLSSVSKQFTAMAIALLEDQEKINENDAITEYLPNLPKYADKITIRHLIHHISGFPDYLSLCRLDEKSDILTNTEILNFLRKKGELKFIPGDHYEYNNTNYLLLALLVENVSDLSFPDFMKNFIFKPAGMKHSIVVKHPFPEINNRVFGYTEWPFFDLCDYNSCNFIYGPGGIYTSLEDMAKWVYALENCTFVNRRMMKKIYSGTQTNNGKKVEYGYGWMLDRYNGHRMIYHEGGWMGFRTYVTYFPSHHLWAITLSNCRGIWAWLLNKELADYFLNIN